MVADQGVAVRGHAEQQPALLLRQQLASRHVPSPPSRKCPEGLWTGGINGT
jgi:hypothetical protein